VGAFQIYSGAILPRKTAVASQYSWQGLFLIRSAGRAVCYYRGSTVNKPHIDEFQRCDIPLDNLFFCLCLWLWICIFWLFLLLWVSERQLQRFSPHSCHGYLAFHSKCLCF